MSCSTSAVRASKGLSVRMAPTSPAASAIVSASVTSALALAIRAEAGGKVFYQTMMKLQATPEAEGVEFIEAIEGKRGPGVALRWDVDPSKRVRRTSQRG